ncbi:glycosyltransferase family 4 protein [Candidatus Bathyarchaeota archaeon]|nr:glycosyltransferase family 4 protein [Candidatus Bathyarchaeota archaeon]
MRKGYAVYIVTGYRQSKDVRVNNQLSVSFLRSFNVPIIKSFLFAGYTFRKLGKSRESSDVDITHVNLPLVQDFAVPSEFGKTLVSTVHSTWKGEAEAIKREPYMRLNSNEKFMVSFNWFLRIFENRMLERSNKIIAVSEYTKRELLKYYRVKQDKIRVIHNGVDIEKFKPTINKLKAKEVLGLDPEDKTILYVGRLYSRKGLFTLIESMPAVVKKFKKAKLMISGKGLSNELKKLISHAEKLGVEKNIVFTGYFPDEKLPQLYQAADIFAFSTFYENLPFAILEAMSTGLPVVTTNVGGIPEIIEDGVNGFLVEPFNSNQLANRILRFLDNPKEAAVMGLAGRKTIEERFDWRLIVKKVLRVYREALN